MSVLPMDFSDVLDTFESPAAVQAFETTGTRDTNGGWKETPGPARTLKGTVVLQLGIQQLALLNQGDVSLGGIALHTKETLYFRNPDNAGGESKQSFVIYQGLTFRVVGTGFQQPNANFNTYNALRHVDDGTVSGNNP